MIELTNVSKNGKKIITVEDKPQLSTWGGIRKPL